MPKTIQIATDVWKKLKIKSAEEEIPISEIANQILKSRQKLSNVRGYLREVINRGDLSERHRNYLKHVDDVIEEAVEG